MNVMFVMAVAFLLNSMLLTHAQSVVAAPYSGESMTESVSGMQFVWVPKGCFLPANMPAAENTIGNGVVRVQQSSGNQLIVFDALDDADVSSLSMQKGNQTCLSRGFWMGKFEVTQAQYQKMMGSNPSAFNKAGNYPVENVRWLDARSFIRKLNKATGKRFRLPSESEWEYAARSAGEMAHFGATKNVNEVAWYMANSGDESHAVGQKKANALGLYDMSGNVWEWTQDCWNEKTTDAPKDGSVWTQGNCSARVLRGGSWFDTAAMLTMKSRLYNHADQSDNNSGFRIVLD